jgi:outer membrane protein assembly factor BamB
MSDPGQEDTVGSIFLKTVRKEMQKEPEDPYALPESLRQCSFLNWWHCNRKRSEKSYHHLKVYSVPEENRAMILACGENGFYSLDALSGTLLWKHEFQKRVISINSIILYNDNIIILTKTGTLQVLRPWSQGIMWEKEVEGAGRFPPLGIGNYLVVASQRDEKTHISGKIQALSLDTGKPSWQREYNLITAPISSGDRVILNLHNGVINALNLADGKVLWEFDKMVAKSKVVTTTSPDTLFVGEQENIYALDSDTGSLKWKYKVLSDIVPQMLLQNGALYIMTKEGLILALDSASGNLVWKYKGSPIKTVFEGYNVTPLLHENNFIISRCDSYLVLNSISGKLKWNAAFTHENMIISPPPVPLPGYVFSTDGFDALHLYDYRKSKMPWRYALGEEISGLSGLESYGTSLYLLTISGDLYCIDAVSLLELLGDQDGVEKLKLIRPPDLLEAKAKPDLLKARSRSKSQRKAAASSEESPLQRDWFSADQNREQRPEQKEEIPGTEQVYMPEKGLKNEQSGFSAEGTDTMDFRTTVKEVDEEMQNSFNTTPGTGPISPEMEKSLLFIKKEVQEIQNLRLSLESRMNILIKNMETLDRSFQKHQDMLEQADERQKEMMTLFKVLADKEWPQEDVYIKHLSHIFKFMQYFKQEIDSMKSIIQERLH